MEDTNNFPALHRLERIEVDDIKQYMHYSAHIGSWKLPLPELEKLIALIGDVGAPTVLPHPAAPKPPPGNVTPQPLPPIAPAPAPILPSTPAHCGS